MRAIEAMTDADCSKVYDRALGKWQGFYRVFKTKGGSRRGSAAAGGSTGMTVRNGCDPVQR